MPPPGVNRVKDKEISGEPVTSSSGFTSRNSEDKLRYLVNFGDDFALCFVIDHRLPKKPHPSVGSGATPTKSELEKKLNWSWSSSMLHLEECSE